MNQPKLDLLKGDSFTQVDTHNAQEMKLVQNRLVSPLERFLFDCRKVIGFASTELHDWLKKARANFTLQSGVNSNHS